MAVRRMRPAAGQSARSLAQQFEPDLGEQGVVASGGLERVGDELREALVLDDRPQLHAGLDAAVECDVSVTLEHRGQFRMTGEPHGDQTAGIEGEVQERGEVAEELGRQILRLVDDPQGQDLLAVGQFGDTQFELAPQAGVPVVRFKPEYAGKRLVQVDATELGLGQVYRLVTVRIEVAREMAQHGGLAHAGLAGEQASSHWKRSEMRASAPSSHSSMQSVFSGAQRKPIDGTWSILPAVMMPMGEFDEVGSGSRCRSRGFNWRLAAPVPAVGERIERGGGAQRLARSVLDADLGAGVWIDDEHDLLAAEFVGHLEDAAVLRDGTVAAHAAFDAMQEQLIELRGKTAERADALQVLLQAIILGHPTLYRSPMLICRSSDLI